ncbi:KdsC family phosphatase [Sediminitomix flava]|uniref:3-deoxy-D-manno-octulosonate 8-phosphate phosphatase KdsC n=1 Tax=Sediminitomix flava TaxID=379075 RepID=A0A315YZ09_SEDFL|nr:HAD hydrolase family protein [Sediminitomix flava]PWJ34138.1 3-deoxy-D-manno-octulosonate 8-phosphate phosphatase (KDO 8-P phosphatase) [Sediminitomix flava]
MNWIDEALREKAKKIKAVVFDIDGVMTDGKIIYAQFAGTEAEGETREIKNFNVKDGFMIKALQKNGIIVGAITGRNSAVVKHRLTELKVDFQYHGSGRKMDHFDKILADYQLKAEEIAYLGDDIPDLGVLKNCGLGVCPADARSYIQSRVDYVTAAKGGEGVFREVAEIVLDAQDKLESVISAYENE